MGLGRYCVILVFLCIKEHGETECADRSIQSLNCSKLHSKKRINLYLIRLIFFTSRDGFTIKPSDTFNKNWENAPNIGYWRVEDNKIKVEYFLCGDSGFYKREQGEIKGDTIVYYENFYNPFYKEVRERYYVLSDMSFE